MFLSLLGLLSIVVGAAVLFQPGVAGRVAGPLNARTGGLGLATIGSALILLATFTVIGVGEVGVVHAFGTVNPNPITSGIHFVRPWASVEKFGIRETQFPGEGEVETMDALSREQMAVEVEVSVRYQIRPEQVVELYQRIGDHDAVESAVLNAIRSGVRDGMARHAISEIQIRDSIANSMMAAVQDKLISREKTELHLAYLTQLFLRKITPPTEVARAINQKIAQEQQIQTETFKVEVEQQKARQRVIEAQGIADAQRIITQTLTPQYLMREYITSMIKASESAGTTVIIPTEGGMPVFDVGAFTRRLRGSAGTP